MIRLGVLGAGRTGEAQKFMGAERTTARRRTGDGVIFRWSRFIGKAKVWQ